MRILIVDYREKLAKVAHGYGCASSPEDGVCRVMLEDGEIVLVSTGSGLGKRIGDGYDMGIVNWDAVKETYMAESKEGAYDRIQDACTVVLDAKHYSESFFSAFIYGR